MINVKEIRLLRKLYREEQQLGLVALLANGQRINQLFILSAHEFKLNGTEHLEQIN